MAKRRFGEILISKGVITPSQLNEALKFQRKNRIRLGEALVQLGSITEGTLVSTLGTALGIHVVDLDQAEISPDAVMKLDAGVARRHSVIPYLMKGTTMLLLTGDPMNMTVLDEVSFHTGCRIRPVLAKPSQIRHAVKRFYGAADWTDRRSYSSSIELSSLEDEDSQMTIVRPGGGGEEIIETATGRVDTRKSQPPPSRPSQVPSRPSQVPSRPSQVPSQPPVAWTPSTPPSSPPPPLGEGMLQERTSGVVTEAFGAMLDAQGGFVDAETFGRLERRFWAVLRLLAKKGMITREEFVQELGEDFQ